MPLDESKAQAIASICLHAALADGVTSTPERDRLQRVFAMVGEESQTQLYRRVMMGGSDLAAEAAALVDAEDREMAYDMAVGVCDADGVTSEAERAFLHRLAELLGMDADRARASLEQGEAIAAGMEALPAPGAPSPAPAVTQAGGAVAAATAAGVGAAAVAAAAATAGDPQGEIQKEIDGMVLRYAILNGAIELLPQDLATIAIIPLQMKMVYRIGKRYGYELSTGHIREFLGVAGLGLASQVLEGYARKLFGKLAGRTLGKTAGKVAGAATGSAMTFATTYALGQVARQYYAGGRTLAAVDLRRMFQQSVDQGRGMYPQFAGEVTQQAGGLDLGRVMSMVRGQTTV